MRLRPHRRTAVAGFTLVEVLVALMVMAIMAVMAWQGVDGIVRARDSNQDRLERSLRLNSVLSQWEQDLAAVQETAVVPSALSFDGASLRLVRRAPGGLQLVVWSLLPDSGSAQAGSNTWLRWAGPAVTTTGGLQDSWLRSQQFQGNEPGQLRTLTGVAQWQVYYFVGNTWSNAQSTGNVELPPPGTVAPTKIALPSGVRLVLSFAPDSGQSGSLIRDIPLLP
ncbi:MAG: general secretion pathway protein GspJ [Methylibium sp. NZG]|nr:MAG: general secretion pathway protein GspJ [Methylibium sp. NZG]